MTLLGQHSKYVLFASGPGSVRVSHGNSLAEHGCHQDLSPPVYRGRRPDVGNFRSGGKLSKMCDFLPGNEFRISAAALF